MKITTESGSYYEIEDGLWSKNGGPKHALWYMYCFEYWEGMTFADIPNPYEDEDKELRLPIQVGMRLKIGSRDEGWTSTTIVSIEGEIEDE